MLIAAGDAAWGGHDPRALASLAATKAVRGETIPAGFDFTGMRIASALAGVIGAGLCFVLMLQLTGAPLRAAALAGLYVFDTALIAQFRAAQLDAFQLSFVLAALICAVAGLRRPRAGGGWGPALGFGAAVGAATMVRANAGLLAAGGPFLVYAAWRAAGFGWQARWRLRRRQAAPSSWPVWSHSIWRSHRCHPTATCRPGWSMPAGYRRNWTSISVPAG